MGKSLKGNQTIIREPRRNSSKRQSKVPQPGAGRRRSDIRGSGSGYIIRKQDFSGVKTETGEIQYVHRGPYEVILEVMAGKASTGLMRNTDGDATLWCKSGSLHIRLVTFEGEEKEQTASFSKLTEGNFCTIPAGQAFELSTGENSVDFVRMQTSGYFDTIEHLSDGVTPEVIDITIAVSNAPEGGLKVKTPDGVSRRQSSDPAYRAKIAEQRGEDRSSVAGRKKITREVRKHSTRDEVLGQRHFVDPHNPDISQASTINPQAIGALSAAEEEQAAQQEAMAYIEQQRAEQDQQSTDGQ